MNNNRTVKEYVKQHTAQTDEHKPMTMKCPNYKKEGTVVDWLAHVVLFLCDFFLGPIDAQHNQHN